MVQDGTFKYDIPFGACIMAKITVYIPEPKQNMKSENQRQIIQSLDTVKTQLNTSYQQDLKNEQDTFNFSFQ